MLVRQIGQAPAALFDYSSYTVIAKTLMSTWHQCDCRARSSPAQLAAATVSLVVQVHCHCQTSVAVYQCQLQALTCNGVGTNFGVGVGEARPEGPRAGDRVLGEGTARAPPHQLGGSRERCKLR